MKKLRLPLLVLLVMLASPARSAPMYSPFSTVRSVSTRVVLGTLKLDTTGNASIVVDKVVSGTAHTGLMPVNPSPDGHINVQDERVVAFVDASNALRWVGRLVAGPSLESGVIKLQGFFDFNAHIVSPGLFTLAQLETALRTGAVTQTFEATFAFPDGHGGLRTVPARHFTLEYDPFAPRIVSGGVTLPCLANQSLGSLSWGSFELSLSDTCLTATSTKTRSLELDGEYTGVTSSGAIAVRVVPTRPFLYEAEYDAFARDTTQADVTRVLRVTLATGEVWTWRLEDALVDPQGKTHADRGVSSTLAQSKSNQTIYTDTYDFTGASIAITPAPSAGSPGGNARGMVQLVESGAITSCTFTQHGLSATSCTLTQGQPIIVRK